MQRYNPRDIEPKWQQTWEDSKIYQASEDPAKPKKYVLEYFPYPSGAAMHVGHVRNYTIGDAIARFNRMNGYNVLHPMGWDAFGLPAENYAIKNKISPRKAIDENTTRFRQQLMQMGFSYDWSREIDSTDPKYYKWTQWFFLLLFKRGLAYQQESLQWWCPHDKTVLANEQVEDGRCWRCGHLVEKKSLKQWFFKITDYADRLLDDLDDLDWSDSIKTMQRNWIGRSDGVVYTNEVRNTDLQIESFSAHFEAFTANTFVVIAPDHPFLPTLLEGLDKKDVILAAAQKMALQRDIEGPKGLEHVEGIFTERYAIDIFGDKDLPIWIANYALADYGTGIVLCSAHDERDFTFAKKYGLRLKPTMVPTDPVEAEKVKNLEYCFTDMKNGILIEPKEFEGKVAGGNRQEIARYMEHEGYARTEISYKIRDWLISRQRYWGAPIPIIHCPNDGAVAVPD
ncbi:MAG TPA: leucine--tRNA ligase, partial [Verrucomicrobiae bacterium]|nr:leucine--tRNA ligase [Verrucomicrobiae bacterium]